jgi:hypothetical protein
MNEFSLRDSTRQIVTIVPTRALAFRELKHSWHEWDFSIVGPEIGMPFYQFDGVVFPSGGTIVGRKVSPSSRSECLTAFGK